MSRSLTIRMMSFLNAVSIRFRELTIGFLVALVLNPIGSRSLRADGIELPEKVRETIQELMASSARGYNPTYLGLSNEQGRMLLSEELKRFNELLSHLADLTDDALFEKLRLQDSSGIEFTLISIARDRRHRPELYQEILQIYGKPASLMTPGPAPPDLRAVHTTEPYRLVWEYCLLAPWSGQIGFMNGGFLRPVYALAEIRDDASLSALGFRFRVNVARAQSRDRFGGQSERMWILDTVSDIRSRPALETMLQMLTVAEAFEDSIGPQVDHWDRRHTTYRQFVLETLSKPSSDAPASKLDSWERVLRKYPIESLSAKDRGLLQSALRTYDVKSK